jgi:hypothetical protein
MLLFIMKIIIMHVAFFCEKYCLLIFKTVMHFRIVQHFIAFTVVFCE